MCKKGDDITRLDGTYGMEAAIHTVPALDLDPIPIPGVSVKGTLSMRFHHTLSLRLKNFRVCSASVLILTVFTLTFKRMMSQRGNDFIAC